MSTRAWQRNTPTFAKGTASTSQGTAIYTSDDISLHNRHWITNSGTDSIKVQAATDNDVTAASATFRDVKIVDLKNGTDTATLTAYLPAGAYGCVVGVFKYLKVLKYTADGSSGNCEIIHSSE